MAFEIFSFSMLLVHFTRHFSPIQILVGFVLFFFVPLPVIRFATRLRTRQLLIVGFVIRWACVSVFIIRPSLPVMLAYYAVSGLIIFFFWVPYNIRYFIFSHHMNRATSAGHFVIVGPILNTFVPLASGVVIARLGPACHLAASSVLAGILVYQAARLPRLDLDYRFTEVMKKSEGLRFLKFIQGVWESGNMAIPLYSLTFLADEIQFGTYLSYLGLVGIIGTLIITRFSDRQHKRLKYFVPFVSLLAVFTISLAFADSLGEWTVVSGAAGIASTLTYPFLFAIVLDKIDDKRSGMIGREFMLNVGRVVGYAAMILLAALTGSMRWGFAVAGGALLVYPLLLIRGRLYVDEDFHPLIHVSRVYASGKRLVARN